jgi:hypothetical protein
VTHSPHTVDPAMKEAQQVHSHFRGAGEVGKRCRIIASIAEIAAAVVVIRGFFTGSLQTWLPLVSFGLLVISAIFRMAADRYKDYSDGCRRISLRSFALGRDIEIRESSNLRSEAPPFALRCAAKLPASSLEKYYEPSSPPGEDRLRELYAYSSFYTSQLAKTSRNLYFSGSILILAAALIVLYLLATSATEEGRELVLDALFSVVLSVIGLRTMEQALKFASLEKNTKRLADALIAQPLPVADVLSDLTFEYDAAVSSAPPIPTTLYRLRREELDGAWRHRRGALSSNTP